ncbi:hypothetical protein TWF569_005116 [Orbilia oligospora]|nr:hypothetical protein TWF569_005116 [Orbilia oligospora]
MIQGLGICSAKYIYSYYKESDPSVTGCHDQALWSKKYPLHHIINFGVCKNSRFYLPTNGPLEPPTRLL